MLQTSFISTNTQQQTNGQTVPFQSTTMQQNLFAQSQVTTGNMKGKIIAQGMKPNQPFYTNQIRQKNLKVNRNNLANIQLDKKGQVFNVKSDEMTVNQDVNTSLDMANN